MPKAAPDSRTVTYSSSTPSEEPVDRNSYRSTATGNEPMLIRLPSINTTAFIQGVGVDQRGEIAVPNNVHLVGWFTQGAKPGEPGLSIIDGHVSGPTVEAVFAKLPRIKVGDQFEVEQADRTVLRYKVVDRKAVATAEAASFLFSQDPAIASQLNLITCIGTFDHKTRSYDKRLIVAAKLL
ncbi:MAG TPA: class F sortase [Candidatus Saccharimonadales bacterium]